MQGVPWEVFWAVTGGLLSVLVTMSFVLYKNVNRRIGEKYDAVDKNITQVEERLNDYYKAHDRLRDKWDEFTREYLKIDSTRGQKVDALFHVVDQMRTAVEQIPRNMNEKVEDAFTRSLSELKLYARDQVQIAVRNVEGKNERSRS